uniref:Uncharacterized protein n=1 Tax=viral metagenome TaxID=1070528 RepID=A0A6C0KEI2_9ZZZZ
MELTDVQKHANYLKLMRVLIDVGDRTHIDQWWKDEHREFIMNIRKHFEDFNCVLVIAQDDEQRTALEENKRRAEILMRNLENSIRVNGTFDIQVYRLFAENVEPLVRQYIPKDELDEISEQLGFMSF